MAIAQVLPRLSLVSDAIVVLVHSHAPIPCFASNSCSPCAMAIPISRGSKLPWRSFVIKHVLSARVWWMACHDDTTSCIQTTTESNPTHCRDPRKVKRTSIQQQANVTKRRRNHESQNARARSFRETRHEANGGACARPNHATKEGVGEKLAQKLMRRPWCR